MGEAENEAKGPVFGGSIRLGSRGAGATADAGLPAARELDEVPGLAEAAAGLPAEGRAGKQRRDPAGLLRRSVHAGPAVALRRRVRRQDDCGTAVLRPGSVHSSSGWREP